MAALSPPPVPPFHRSFRLGRQALPFSAPFVLPPGLVATTSPPMSLRMVPTAAEVQTTIAVSSDEIPPNALRRKRDPLYRGGFSLGIDLGSSRTGLAISKGFSVRPLTVLQLRGQKLERSIMEIALKEEVDELIIGLPMSNDGKETPQSNKVRSIAGRLAASAAERGWRVYLLDEHGTTEDALDIMIDLGLSKSSRHAKIDAYAAMVVLQRYFSMSGEETELVWPKRVELQEKLRITPKDDDLSS